MCVYNGVLSRGLRENIFLIFIIDAIVPRCLLENHTCEVFDPELHFAVKLH